ncbi:hypothetical protein LX64_03128 [Chitinophaga skermanii]|uniref:Uncharacterized protein n=1 Tax=Chitinophaga skermanii TaxID=331697 RepID=A0A327QJR3_9BACT|nr:hypothetical protein [Chitinophaga skermanii]RAJ04248.1 hypothetical protein LX64_03128 [Chitinophaga skermanii]
MEKLLKEVRFLKIYSFVLTLVLCGFIFLSFKPLGKERFTEIDVERINVVEKDGQLKMVISNQARQHPGMFNNKPLPPRERQAGMIFFNSRGDECGGLIYDGNENENGMVYSVDQNQNDQVLQIQYNESRNGQQLRRTYGLKMWDRSDEFKMEKAIKEFAALDQIKDEQERKKAVQALRDKGYLGRERMFVGKTTDEEVGLFIRDNKGTPRIKIYVNKANEPVMEFLDEQGNKLKSAN